MKFIKISKNTYVNANDIKELVFDNDSPKVRVFYTGYRDSGSNLRKVLCAVDLTGELRDRLIQDLCL